jgi:hypothetical protein
MIKKSKRLYKKRLNNRTRKHKKSKSKKIRGGGNTAYKFPRTDEVVSDKRKLWIERIYPHSMHLLQTIQKIKWEDFMYKDDNNIIRLDQNPYVIFGGSAHEIYNANETYHNLISMESLVNSTADIDVMVNVQMNKELYDPETEGKIVQDFLLYIKPQMDELRKNFGDDFEKVDITIEEGDRIRVNLTVSDFDNTIEDHALEFIFNFFYHDEKKDKSYYRWMKNSEWYDDSIEEGDFTEFVKEFTYHHASDSVMIDGYRVRSLWLELKTNINILFASQKTKKSNDYDKFKSRVGRATYALTLLLELYIVHENDILISKYTEKEIETNIQDSFFCNILLKTPQKIGFIDKKGKSHFVDIKQIIHSLRNKYEESSPQRFKKLINIIEKRAGCKDFLKEL